MNLQETINAIAQSQGSTQNKHMAVYGSTVTVNINFRTKAEAINFCRCWADSIVRHHKRYFEMHTTVQGERYAHRVEAAHAAPAVSNTGRARK